MNMKVVMGIDIANNSFGVYVSGESVTYHFGKYCQRLYALLELASRHEISLFIVEATGNYHRALIDALELHSFGIAVVNSRLIKNFSRALGLRSKTDEQDARLIRVYGMHMDKLVREKPDKELFKLKAVVSRRR